jgi:hypothetical protein
MPFLSLLLYQVIITYLPFLQTAPIWYRQPPLTPPDVILFQPFIYEWNMGLHGKMQRLRNRPSMIQLEETAWTTTDVTAATKIEIE